MRETIVVDLDRRVERATAIGRLEAATQLHPEPEAALWLVDQRAEQRFEHGRADRRSAQIVRQLAGSDRANLGRQLGEVAEQAVQGSCQPVGEQRRREGKRGEEKRG